MKRVWTGIIEVLQREGHATLQRRRAVVNALVPARSAPEYKERVTACLAALGLDAVDFEEVEPFEPEGKHSDCEPEYLALSRLAATTGEVHFGEFFTWAEEDS